jgi:hypothetical protein
LYRQKHKNQVLTFDEMIKGIPFWELGNARYLHKMFGGDVVSPETVYDKCSFLDI